jgi:hypothetical protein
MKHVTLAGLALLSAATLAGPAAAQVVPAAALHGFVREAGNGEPVNLAFVVVGEQDRGAHSRRDGYYSLAGLPPGPVRVRVRALGYSELDTTLTLLPSAALRADFRLAARALPIAGVQVQGVRERQRPFDAPEVSVEVVTPEAVRRVPAALEPDLFRALQAMPGVVSPGVLSSRLLVRGGAADQNLFLLDGFPVIYPYHLTGAFSAFHVDAVRDAEFWIGAPPARFGGRLSSVLDVALREGNRGRTTGTASLGLISSSAVVEGPHRSGAWFVGARRTYLDLVSRGVGQEVPYHFYDAYGKSYIDVGPNDRVSALVFLGRDNTWRIDQRNEDHFDWGNDVFGVSWRHLWGGRAVFEQRASLSRFSQTLRGGYSSKVQSRIDTDHRTSLRALAGDVRADLGRRHRVELGYSAQWQEDEHRTAYDRELPGAENSESQGSSEARTIALYVQDDASLGSAVRVRVGIRSETSGRFHSIQPRAAAKLLLNERVSLSAGAGLLRQYDKIVQDPDVNFDLYSADIWATAHEPGAEASRSAHLIGGVEAQLPRGMRFRGEFYRKSFEGLLSAAPYSADLRVPATDRLEQADGIARGVDLSLAREAPGPLRGWLGYSFAASTRTVDARTFHADPHPRQRVVAVLEGRRGDRWSISGRFEAFEGVPFTPSSATVIDRGFDFSLGRFADPCVGTFVEFIEGTRNSARTGWSKRLDAGGGRRWTDRRGRRWELSLSVLNALFDPTGVFRPKLVPAAAGCRRPVGVEKEHELVLPPIPSVSVRVEF